MGEKQSVEAVSFSILIDSQSPAYLKMESLPDFVQITIFNFKTIFYEKANMCYELHCGHRVNNRFL